MKYINSDIIDWESLSLTILPTEPYSDPDKQGISDLLTNFFLKRSQKKIKDELLKYWDITILDDGTIKIVCEIFSDKGIRALGKKLSESYNKYNTIIIGEDAIDFPLDNKIKWQEVKCANNRKILISHFHITIGQYFEFLDNTEYITSFEKSRGEEDGKNDRNYYFKISQICTGGKKAHLWPVNHIDYYDALAYCKWINGRLPTNTELYLFFKSFMEKGKNFNFTNENWTQTKKNETEVYTLSNPTFFSKNDVKVYTLDQLQSVYPMNNWDYPFISFRACLDI